MSTVWAFGDSMTAPFNGIPSEPSPYRMWLGRDAKDTSTFVAEHYGFQSKNKAVYGSSNAAIFHQFVQQLKNIESGDILIFGWTAISRYRIVENDKSMFGGLRWKNISQGILNNPGFGCVDGTHVTKEVAQQFLLNRCDFQSLYEGEVNEWIDFINDWAKLKEVKVIHWSWCNSKIGGKQNLNLSFPVINYTDMTKESNGMIKDVHYGERGHYELSKDINKYIDKLI